MPSLAALKFAYNFYSQIYLHTHSRKKYLSYHQATEYLMEELAKLEQTSQAEQIGMTEPKNSSGDSKDSPPLANEKTLTADDLTKIKLIVSMAAAKAREGYVVSDPLYATNLEQIHHLWRQNHLEFKEYQDLQKKVLQLIEENQKLKNPPSMSPTSNKTDEKDSKDETIATQRKLIETLESQNKAKDEEIAALKQQLSDARMTRSIEALPHLGLRGRSQSDTVSNSSRVSDQSNAKNPQKYVSASKIILGDWGFEIIKTLSTHIPTPHAADAKGDGKALELAKEICSQALSSTQPLKDHITQWLGSQKISASRFGIDFSKFETHPDNPNPCYSVKEPGRDKAMLAGYLLGYVVQEGMLGFQDKALGKQLASKKPPVPTASMVYKVS